MPEITRSIKMLQVLLAMENEESKSIKDMEAEDKYINVSELLTYLA
jgi:hypothetical protein